MESSSTCISCKLAGTETWINHCLTDRCWITNRPFYQYGGHIELRLDLRSIMGCPGGMRTIRYTCISIYARFSGQRL